MKLLDVLVSSMAQTLTTRLLIEQRQQSPSGNYVMGDTLNLTLPPKLLASVIDELARNTAQAIQPLCDEIQEAYEVMGALYETLDTKEFRSPEHQAVLSRVRSFLAERALLEVA